MHQMIGINFADRSEADSFKQAIVVRLIAKEKKKKERTQQTGHNRQGASGPQPHLQSQQQQVHHSPTQKKKKKKKSSKKGNKASGLSSLDISTPTNFQHISHVGFDPNQDDNEVLKGFFDIVGVKAEQWNDANTKKFILDFINENGGIEKAMEETELYGTMPGRPKIEHQVDGAAGYQPGSPRTGVPPGPPPTRSPAPPPGQRMGTGKPQPPQKGRSQVPFNAKPNQSRGPSSPSVPPPSVPPPRMQGPPPGKAGPPPPPPPSGPGGPPPPPPPPPPGGGPLPGGGPPPPPPASKPNPGGNMSSPKPDFLSQISAGGNHLKKAEPVQRQVSSGDPRGNLLDEIQRGKALKKVDRQVSTKAETFEAGGMAGALAAALNSRKQNIQHSDDDSDGEEDSDIDDEEWDD